METESERISVTLSRDEAVVFFDWLNREYPNTRVPGPDEAEAEVFSELLAQLELVLVEPFRDDYLEILAAARARITRAGKE